MWNDITSKPKAQVDDTIDETGKKKRPHCFTHSSQLVVSDELKQTAAINLAYSKCSKICTQLHSSCSTKKKFEQAYGSHLSIPADVPTRWNSTYKQVKAILGLGMIKLNDLLKECSPNLAFSVKEWSQLMELATILHPFSEATDVTQGENMVTSSYVVPCVISLYQHLQLQKYCARHRKKLAAALRGSLTCRLKGTSK